MTNSISVAAIIATNYLNNNNVIPSGAGREDWCQCRIQWMLCVLRKCYLWLMMREGDPIVLCLLYLCGSSYRDYPGIISHSAGFTDIGPDQTVISDKGSSTSSGSQDQMEVLGCLPSN